MFGNYLYSKWCYKENYVRDIMENERVVLINNLVGVKVGCILLKFDGSWKFSKSSGWVEMFENCFFFMVKEDNYVYLNFNISRFIRFKDIDKNKIG